MKVCLEQIAVFQSLAHVIDMKELACSKFQRRSLKTPTTSVFKEHEKWRVALINEVTKVREVDKDFRN